jgi:hypothetical protein
MLRDSPRGFVRFLCPNHLFFNDGSAPVLAPSIHPSTHPHELTFHSIPTANDTTPLLSQTSTQPRQRRAHSPGPIASVKHLLFSYVNILLLAVPLSFLSHYLNWESVPLALFYSHSRETSLRGRASAF